MHAAGWCQLCLLLVSLLHFEMLGMCRLITVLSCKLPALGPCMLQAGVNLCLLLVSRQQPAAQGLLGLLPGVVPLAFPAYSDSQLVDILGAVSIRCCF